MPTISTTIALKDKISSVIKRVVDKTREAAVELKKIESISPGAKAKVTLDKAADSQEKLNQKLKLGTEHSNKFASTLKTIAATYLSFQGVKSVIQITDQLVSSQAKISMINDGLQTQAELNDMIFQSAQRSRGSYMDTAEAVARLGSNAGEAFSSTKEIVQFSEQINKQFAIAGTETAAMQGAFTQLVQAMGAGGLRGDEFNSIMEACPPIMQKIAGYMGVSVGQLKNMASEGMITADIVKSSLLTSAEETNEKFAQMPKTFGQIFMSMKNEAIKSFEPVLQKLSEVLNSEGGKQFISGINAKLKELAMYCVGVFDKIIALGSAFYKWAGSSELVEIMITRIKIYGWYLSQIVEIVFNVFTAFASWNGSATTVKLLAQSILVVLGVIGAVKGMFMAWNAVLMVQKGLMYANVAIHYVYALATGASVAPQTAATAAAWGFNTALLANPITWVIVAIAALIGIIILLALNWDKVKAVALRCWEFLKTTWGKIVDFFAPIFNSFFQIISSVFQKIWAVIGPVLTAIFNLHVAIWGAIINIVSAICQGIWAVICRVFNAIYNFVAPIVQNCYNAVSSAFTSMYTAVAEPLSNIWEKVKETFETCLNWLKGLGTKLFNIGRDMLTGLLNGMTEKLKDVTSFVTSLGEKISGGIKKFFKIDSPSKLMRQLGNYTFGGFNLGLQDQLKNINGSTVGLTGAISGNLPDKQMVTSGNKNTGNSVYNSPNIRIEINNTIDSKSDVDNIIRELERRLAETMNNSYQGVY